MDDPLKKVADQSVNGKPDAPRFDPGQLMYAEINNRYVTFYLKTHAVAVTIEDLTAEEAALAKLYYRGPDYPAGDEDEESDSNSPKTADASADQIEAPETDVVTDTDDKIKELLDDRDYEMVDAVTYRPKDHRYRWRLIFASICLLFFFGLILYAYIGDGLGGWPFNNDKNDAIAIAMQDVSLRQFLEGKDLAVDSQAFYYDPVRKVSTESDSEFMLVQIAVYGMIVHSNDNFDIVLEQFSIIVDLENKSIVSTKSSLTK